MLNHVNLTIHYSHSCVPTSNLTDAQTQNGRPISLPPLIVLWGCYGKCLTLLWMPLSVLHIFITDLCSGHYWLRSGPGWAEWPAGRQTYSAISQTWQHAGRHIHRKHGRVEQGISHAQAQAVESEILTHWVCPSLIDWGDTTWAHFYFSIRIKGNLSLMRVIRVVYYEASK